MEDQPRRGPMSEDPRFQTVSAPDEFPITTDGAVRFVPVTRRGTVVGYIWAAVANDAAGYVPREAAGDDGFNTGVRWVERLLWAKANGLAPLDVLAQWAGQPEDDRAGYVPPDVAAAASTAASLSDLRALSAR